MAGRERHSRKGANIQQSRHCGCGELGFSSFHVISQKLKHWSQRTSQSESRMKAYQVSSDVTFCIEASRHVSRSGGGVSTKRASRLASFKRGVENGDIRSFAAWLYCMTGSGSDSDCAMRGAWISQAPFKMKMESCGQWVLGESLGETNIHWPYLIVTNRQSFS